MPVDRFPAVLFATLCAGVLWAPIASPAGLSLETRLKKTLLRIDAAYATVDLSSRTADRVSSIRQGRRCDDAMRTELERALLDTDHADFSLEFRRKISLDRLINGYRGNWKRMIRAGLLERDFDVESEARRQRARFSFLETPGLRPGDCFFFRLRGDTVSMRFVDARGVQQLDETEIGAFPRRSLLSAYFLKGSELRDGLLRSACP